MKIIIFDGSFKTTAFINRLIEGLTKTHEVYVLGFNETLKHKINGVHYVKLGSNSSKLAFIKTSWSIAVSQSSLKKCFSTLLQLIKFNRKALQSQNLNWVIEAINPDIIHAQWVSNIAILEPILSQNRYPVVLSQRGYHINVRPFIDEENMGYLKDWLPKMAGFHSVSKAISSKGDLIYTSPSKIDHVVYSGLNLLKVAYREKYQKTKRMELISVGRPHWKKGYDYAIKACALLKAHGIDFKYTIIGAGQHEELIYLREFYKLEDVVELLSPMPQQAVFEAIKEADAMLLPSIEEGIANVAIEAMALGTLVVSTDCGGMPELIAHNKDGWVVPKRSPEALAEAIMDFSKTPDDKLENMCQQARKKVERQFTEDKMVQDMERLYKACINEDN
ncbi:glycosyltransferase family 4 protein [uncultured Algibacter sp.]|uniref:glycosyltransferase family 4 protein n=1 Tax=uncultured Algibacter sp. TaxID=298659 RepID=UPI002618772D|nr:glycosyltransferase family 4 protein [uncultured Algibacter sp.]